MNIKIYINNLSAELGFYKSQKIYEKALMSMSLSKVNNYSFNILGMEEIYSEVFENNKKSINIFKRLCFMEESFLRSHIVSNGKRIGIHLFGLLKNDWNMYRNSINSENSFVLELVNV
jgi:RimJ/RimL family protein N-acetyltransferase